MDRQYLTPEELSARYRGAVSPKTLANWRSSGKGPIFTKLEGKVFYALADVAHWEDARRQSSSSGQRAA